MCQHNLYIPVNLCASPSSQYLRSALISLANEELYKILFKGGGSQITVLLKRYIQYISRDLNSKSSVEEVTAVELKHISTVWNVTHIDTKQTNKQIHKTNQEDPPPTSHFSWIKINVRLALHLISKNGHALPPRESLKRDQWSCKAHALQTQDFCAVNLSNLSPNHCKLSASTTSCGKSFLNTV